MANAVLEVVSATVASDEFGAYSQTVIDGSVGDGREGAIVEFEGIDLGFGDM